MQGNCAFCSDPAELKESHVLPAFVFRWLRTRSGKGHLRHTDNPNRRIQDGLKLHWLCGTCEGQFGRYETAFATNVFHPWHSGDYRITYKDWMLRLCVSVSWRVLKYARGRNADAQYSEEQNRLMDEAESRWHSFLRDEVPDPAKFEQHMLIFDFVKDTTVDDLPNNFNRFMTGAVTLDIVGSEQSLMTFAKLGRFIIFGIIQKGPNRWEGTKIHVKDGVLKPGKFVIPAGLLDLFREKADITRLAMAQISAKQRSKIDQNTIDNLDAFSASGQFSSIMADADMFGVDAVISKSEYDTKCQSRLPHPSGKLA